MGMIPHGWTRTLSKVKFSFMDFFHKTSPFILYLDPFLGKRMVFHIIFYAQFLWDCEITSVWFCWVRPNVSALLNPPELEALHHACLVGLVIFHIVFIYHGFPHSKASGIRLYPLLFTINQHRLPSGNHGSGKSPSKWTFLAGKIISKWWIVY